MTSLLDGLMDSRLIPVVTWLIIGVIVAIIGYAAFRIVRMLTAGTYIAGGRNRRTRLAVLDAAAVDDRRRLVLIRRDDVEHLILIGGPTDVVVEQDIRIGVRAPRAQAAEPAVALAADPDLALDAYDHGDEALQPNPVPPPPPRPVPAAPQRQAAPAPQRQAAPAPQREVRRAPERPPVRQAPVASRPVNAEPAPAPAPTPAPPPPAPPIAAHQQVATRPVAPVPARQPLAPVAQQTQAPAAPQQMPAAPRQQRTIRPVLPRVTLPAATQPNFAQPAEERRDPPVVARVTPHPARAQATRRAQQQQPQPAAAPVENDLDDALLQELETSLRYPARERNRAKAADIDEEMNKLLGEMSRDRR
ncbi:flagellar biosynthetic protein FliO [Aquibium microcysteis]|uniref:flagellar biosynthetic protein FliO n=1 Tax=Aquibium microcysteis TaxID=675281 RepID=UPI001EF25AB2|nr:flagellar biosynthetic protein FliO [Aquibium microcysteis]